jgi:hypothetical protein
MTGAGHKVGAHAETKQGEKQMKCKQCKTVINIYEKYPKGLCVECYTIAQEDNDNLTSEQLSRIWGF